MLSSTFARLLCRKLTSVPLSKLLLLFFCIYTLVPPTASFAALKTKHSSVSKAYYIEKVFRALKIEIASDCLNLDKRKRASYQFQVWCTAKSRGIVSQMRWKDVNFTSPISRQDALYVLDRLVDVSLVFKYYWTFPNQSYSTDSEQLSLRKSTFISYGKNSLESPLSRQDLDSILASIADYQSITQIEDAYLHCPKYEVSGETSLSKTVMELIKEKYLNINHPKNTDFKYGYIYYKFPNLFCSDKEIRDKALKQALDLLDDKTAYYTASNNKPVSEKGSVGISFSVKDGKVIVAKVYEDSSAYEAFISVGDRIISINNYNVNHLSEDEILSKLSGPLNSLMSLTIERFGLQRNVDLIRKSTSFPEIIVSYKYSMPTMIINHFVSKDGSPRDILYSLSEDYDSLLIDLRGNIGGNLDSIKFYASAFTGSGHIFAIIRTNKGLEYLKTDSDKIVPDSLKLYFLVDEFTQSGAEMLVAYLQEIGRAKVIGKKTAGESIMFENYSFKSGEKLYLPFAESATPRKKLIKGIGVKPDYILDSENYNLQHQDAALIILNEK